MMTREEEIKMLEEENAKLDEVIAEEESGRGFIQKAAEMVDVIDAPFRQAVSKGMEKGIVEGVKSGVGLAADEAKGFTKSIDRGLDFRATAPSGEELLEEAKQTELGKSAIGKKVLGVATSEEPIFGMADWLTPKAVSGFAVESVISPTPALLKYGIKGAAKATRVASAIDKYATKKFAQSLAKHIDKDSFIKKGIDPDVLANRLSAEKALYKNINDPDKMLEAVSGETRVRVKGDGKDSFIKKEKAGNGLIGNIAKEIDDDIAQVAENIPPIRMDSMRAKYIDSIKKVMNDPLNAEMPRSKEMFQKIGKIFNSYIKPAGAGEARTVDQLHKMKKSINARLSSEQFYAPASEAVTLEKKVLEDIAELLKDEISGALKGSTVRSSAGKVIDAGEAYAQKNNRLHNMMQIREVFVNSKLDKYKTLTPGQWVAGSFAGAGVGGIAFGPRGAILGFFGGPYAAQKAQRITELYPGFMGKLTKSAAEGLTIPKQYANVAGARLVAPSTGAGYEFPDQAEETRTGTHMSQGRFPQSIDISGIRKKLGDTPIPRSTKEVLAKQDFVLAKISELAPDIAEHAKMLIDKNPEEIDKVMSLASDMFPQMFTPDKYARWDNVVPKTHIKLASEAIRKDPTLNNTERMNLINRLHTTGRMEYEPEKAK